MSRRRAGMLATAALAAVAAALVIWVVPAFSGGTANRWTWVSGRVVTDVQSQSSLLSAFNSSTDPQQVTVGAVIPPTGAAVAPTTAATVTIPAGKGAEWAFNCSGIGGCEYVYTVETQSPDVIPSVAYMEEGAGGPNYTGLVTPGDFQVFGPNQLTTDATAQNISNANAFFQVEITDLQKKTADLQDKVGALQGDTNQLKSDTAALKTNDAALQGDNAQLRKSAKKLQKQLKKVLKAVR